jgi:hypothetical protein
MAPVRAASRAVAPPNWFFGGPAPVRRVVPVYRASALWGRLFRMEMRGNADPARFFLTGVVGDAQDARLHGPGAVPRRRRGHPGGHLQPGLHPVPPPEWAGALSRWQRGPEDGRAPAAPARGSDGGAAGAGRGPPPPAGEKAGRALRHAGSGRRGPAPVLSSRAHAYPLGRTGNEGATARARNAANEPAPVGVVGRPDAGSSRPAGRGVVRRYSPRTR